MATIQSDQKSAAQPTMDEEAHPHWIRAFQREIRSQQLADDHQAWAAVTGTLITIVTVGVILAAVTVSICLRH